MAQPFERPVMTPAQLATYTQLVADLSAATTPADQQAARVLALIPGDGDLTWVPGAFTAAEAEATPMTEEEICDTATSYANGYAQVQARTGMSAEALDELLLNNNIEACPNCGWHTDCYHLVDDNSEPDGYCDNCRNHDKPKDE